QWPSMPSWIRYVNFYGEVTWSLLPVEFWQHESASLSVGIDVTDADCLVIHYADQAHPSVSDGVPQFYVRRRDVKRELERLSSTTAAPPPSPLPASLPAPDRQPEDKVGPDPFEKPKETVETRLASIMKDIGLKKSGLFPREVLKAVKQPYKNKY